MEFRKNTIARVCRFFLWVLLETERSLIPIINRIESVIRDIRLSAKGTFFTNRNSIQLNYLKIVFHSNSVYCRWIGIKLEMRPKEILTITYCDVFHNFVKNFELKLFHIPIFISTFQSFWWLKSSEIDVNLYKRIGFQEYWKFFLIIKMWKLSY